MLGKRGRNPCGNMDIIYSFSVYWHQCTSLPKRWTFLYIPPAPHSRPHIAQYATSLEQGKPHPQETSRARIIYKCIPTGQYNNHGAAIASDTQSQLFTWQMNNWPLAMPSTEHFENKLNRVSKQLISLTKTS